MIPNYPLESSRKSYQFRQDLRVPTSFLVDVILDNGRAVFGKVEDLSLNGAKLRLPVCLASGSLLKLDFSNQQLTLKAACRWSATHDWTSGSYLTGISFVEVKPDQYSQLRLILFNLAG